jgi:ribonucleoside-diphosphate reductase alpha subunit
MPGDNMISPEMRVTKRNGSTEEVSFDKILNRVKLLGLRKHPQLVLNYSQLIMKVIDQLYTDIPTRIIDELTAEQCASLSTKHLDYGILASRIIISNNHKNTDSLFYNTVHKLYHFTDIHNKKIPLIDKDVWNIVETHKDTLETMIDYSRDDLIDYFGFKTLERAYLMRADGKVIERPQHMWLRVALGIHKDDFVTHSSAHGLANVKETYDLMSQKYFTHATPTLFNSATPRPQLSSCYLISMENDSIDGIYNTLKECAQISKWAGGIGLHIHNIRATGSHIRGTNGVSNGIVPMLRVFNATARYVDQGGGKRNGSFAIYMEPWHGDIEEFLDLRKNHGDEENRARDLFYALWIPSLFMERVKEDGDWSLFCPDACPGLSDCYGDEFNQLYNKYCNEGKAMKTIKARSLWFKILDSQMETGTPYLLYKDEANNKSNQKNLGTIKSSNLCTEIIEYSDKNETAVCNLASIGLSNFVKITPSPFKGGTVVIYTKKKCNWCVMLKLILRQRHIDYTEYLLETEEEIDSYKEEFNVETIPLLLDNGISVGGFTDVLSLLRHTFDYEKLHAVAKVITANLNKIIDVNFYPTDKTRRSNLLHRPIGIGVQGLADTFAKMDIAYHSDEAKELNKLIFETIYHASLERSNELATERIEDMKTVGDYVEWDVNIFAKPRDDMCRTYMNVTEADKPIFERVKPIAREARRGRGKLCGAYSTFEGSPTSQGILQFDMWGVTPSDRYDWDALKEKIQTTGLRNSLLVAPMPTASTAQILGNNECFEPFTSNIYTRRTNAGDYTIVNKHMMRDLHDIGVWTNDLKDNIILNKGSIQHLTCVPQFLKDKYKIVWEIPMKHMIDMAADRGAYICQSQSLNLWLEDPDYKSLTSMHFYAWKKGLKTGIYYLRRKARHQPQQFTIGPEKTMGGDEEEDNLDTDNIIDETEMCEMCSS